MAKETRVGKSVVGAIAAAMLIVTWGEKSKAQTIEEWKEMAEKGNELEDRM